MFFDHGITVSYSELDDQVRRVADGLLELGVRKGAHVALMMANVIEFPVTWLAIAWVGAVTVQLNPKFTGRELDYALNDADVDFLVIDAESLPSLEAMEKRSDRLPDSNIIVRNDGSGVAPAHVAWQTFLAFDPLPREPRAGVATHDVITIIYTSGTTASRKAACWITGTGCRSQQLR